MFETPALSWNALPGAPLPGTVLAQIDEIDDGGALLLTLENNQSPFRIILLRSAGQVFAYVNRCAHLGVPLAAKTEHLYLKPHQNLTCSVHYARFRWSDGVCDYGDCAGESLLSIPINIIGKTVVVAETTG
jgi:nitrite reductase/ring-hydroxylating ferredoxin subunit